MTTDLTTLSYTDAVTCRPSDSITDVAEILRNSGAGSVVVTDDARHLLGIVTDRDLVIRGLAEGRAVTTPVEDVMTRDPAYVYTSEDVPVATTRMLQRRCRRLPVLDSEGAVVGVISLDDLLQAYAQQVEMLATVVGYAGAWDRVISVG